MATDFESVETYYRKPGKTILDRTIFGGDLFDTWVGRFYVGVWGWISLAGVLAALAAVFLSAHGSGDFRSWQSGDYDLLRGAVNSPPRQFGLAVAPFYEGGAWQLTVIFATVAFVGWALREVDICRKLEMGYHVPVMFATAISAWLSVQLVRPLLMGCWCEGMDLGFTAHLTWTSNYGWRFFNWYMNPWHDLALAGFFLGAMLLSMHGSAILGTFNTDKNPKVEMLREDNFWRDYVGYSIGEYGIHRLLYYWGLFTLINCDLMDITAGPLVKDYIAIWQWHLPWIHNLPWLQ
jgi:hypothetical protein